MPRPTSAPSRRRIPSVDSLLRREEIAALAAAHGHGLVTAAVRAIVDQARARLDSDSKASGILDDLPGMIVREVAARMRSTLRRVLNATGVVVHTNLGRAPLSAAARERVAAAASSWCALEYDLVEGKRGSRSSHLERCLRLMFPDHAALAVNNNAAAVFLALHTLSAGRETIISRGELVEIGGSFRIPDVMAASGALLREVGTTNRTRLDDYGAAIGPRTGLILKVHTSNYRIVGFTQQAGVRELAELAALRGLPLMVDQGSGCLRDLSAAGIRHEPTVDRLLADGATVVTFSGDKLLGGPQAGVLVGAPDVIARMKASPLYRVLRLDKMAIAALEATLDSWLRGAEKSELPVQKMIAATAGELAQRARAFSEKLGRRLRGRAVVELVEGASRVGGGAAPEEDLPTTLVSLRPAAGARGDGVEGWEEALRGAPVPVIVRIADGTLLLDLRTVEPEEEQELEEALAACLAPAGSE